MIENLFISRSINILNYFIDYNSHEKFLVQKIMRVANCVGCEVEEEPFVNRMSYNCTVLNNFCKYGKQPK